MCVKWWNPTLIVPTNPVPFLNVSLPLRVMICNVQRVMFVKWMIRRVIALIVNLGPFASPRIKDIAKQAKPTTTKLDSVCLILANLLMYVCSLISKDDPKLFVCKLRVKLFSIGQL